MVSIATSCVVLPVTTIEPCGEPAAVPVFFSSVAFAISLIEEIRPDPSDTTPGSPAAIDLTSSNPVPSAEYRRVVEPVLSKAPRSVPLAPPDTKSGPGQTTLWSAGFTSKLPLAEPKSTDTATGGAKTKPVANKSEVAISAIARLIISWPPRSQ